ncbi:hypothetical protein QR680_017579 [Steinernema hermaphroditum]|uniref:Uncharacterized protein n=1 Tax=Steinernema hermaphroditum TaxID=289476 RepID=A0AA39HH54_9BILA|nr:hypothetical protein QR680_017579 [Steinernema hermaphroditum]
MLVSAVASDLCHYSPRMSYGRFLLWDTNDAQIRAFGWLLLLLWISGILYITREFWFGFSRSHNSPDEQ